LRALGHTVDEKSLVGVIVPLTGNPEWMILLTFEKAAYVRDDDARDWHAGVGARWIELTRFHFSVLRWPGYIFENLEDEKKFRCH
jgi:hypothetical protein